MKCKSGKVDQVADLIENEYIPKLAELDGVVSYTVVQSSLEEIACIGIFTTETGAIAAGGLAGLFVDERLARLGASLGDFDGPILVHAGAPS
jgi:hypothetical protein